MGVKPPIQPHSSSPPFSALFHSIFGLSSSFPYPISSSCSFFSPFPSKSKNHQILSFNNRLSLLLHFWSTALPSTMAPKVGSKRKGKEPICEDFPPRFDYSSYPSQKAFDRYSTRTITYCRIVNFECLGFMGFNQMMRRM